MKVRLSILLLSVVLSLSSLTLIDGDRSHELSLENLESFGQKEKTTHREKNNKVKEAKKHSISHIWLIIITKIL